MKYFLTLDIGTTSVKTCLFDKKLKMVGQSNEEYVLITESDILVELEAERYWEAVRDGIDEVLHRSCIDPKNVVSAAVTTQGETMIPVDENGNALRNAIVWLDQRAGKQAESIGRQVSADEYYAHTGLPELNGYTPIAKLMWIRENEPGIYAQTYKFLLLEDYIIMKLTGKFVTEKSLISSTGWFDIREDACWDEILRIAEIDRSKLPDILECGEIVDSPVLKDMRDRFGFADSVKVVTGAMDQVSAAVGAGNSRPGLITETTGTALCVCTTVTQFQDVPDKDSRINVCRHIHKGSYVVMPFAMTAGMFLKWFKDKFCYEETLAASQRGISIYELIDEIVSGTEPTAGGIIALPYLTGTQRPINNPNARGVFTGFGLDSGKPQFLRAIFESIAFLLRENIEFLSCYGLEEIDEIRSMGGGSKSRIWRQIKADVLGKSVAVLSETECTSLGVAIMSAVALGYCEDELSAAAMALEITEVSKPQKKYRELYDQKYAKYCKILPGLSEIFDVQ